MPRHVAPSGLRVEYSTWPASRFVSQASGPTVSTVGNSPRHCLPRLSTRPLAVSETTQKGELSSGSLRSPVSSLRPPRHERRRLPVRCRRLPIPPVDLRTRIRGTTLPPEPHHPPPLLSNSPPPSAGPGARRAVARGRTGGDPRGCTQS